MKYILSSSIRWLLLVLLVGCTLVAGVSALDGFAYSQTVAYTACDQNVYQQNFVIHRSTGTAYEETTGGLKVWHLYVGTNCKTDYGDLRFTDAAGTELAYYLWPDFDATSAKVTVRLAGATSAGSVTMWYGNAGAATTSSGNAVFSFFDQFEGATLSTSNWGWTGTPSVANSVCTVPAGKYLYGKTNFGTGYITHIRVKYGSASAVLWAGLESGTGETDSKYIDMVNNGLAYAGSGSSYTGVDHGVNMATAFRDVGFTRTGGSPTYTIIHIDGVEKLNTTTYASTSSRHPVVHAYSGSSIMVDHVIVRAYSATPPAATAFTEGAGKPTPTPTSTPTPAPVANFIATPTSGSTPLVVQFTDTSTGTPTAWSWDFGDGQTSTAQHPSHTYTAAGTYTVTLNASNAYGSDTETKTGLVTVSASGPHHVATYADLCKVGTGVDGWTLDASYVQTADIQCPTGAERTGFTPIGEEYTPFEGTYDGGGYAIRDLYVNQDDYHYDAGLFGRVGGGAQIIGVTLTDPVVYGFTEAGGLIGYAEGTAASHITVTNCYVVRGTVYAESDCGGGLIGLAKYVDLQSCTTSGALPTWCGYLSGGMVGQMNSGSMTDCHSSMSVQPGYGGIGGLIGSLFDTCTITQCSATGQVSGSEVNPSGGLIGNIYTNGDAVVTITECFASGDLDIQLREEVGGFIGSVKGGYMTSLLVDITDCYTRGTIGPLTGSGSNSGGFIGRSDNNKVTLTRCYSSRTITTPDKADGFIGRIWTSAVETYTCFWDVGTAGKTTSIAVGVIGKTTIEMKTLATFTSWNIATPTASFTATPASGTTPLTVRFTDTSTGSPLAWSWSFDDGTTSTAQHPTHTYTNPGIYSVTLTVANAHGSNTYTKIRTVVAQNPPIPIKPVITSPTYNTTIQYDMANGTYLQYWLYNVTTFGDIPIYGFAYGIMAPLMNVWGYWTFVIIWLAYLFIVWIRTSDIGLPIVIGLLTAGVWGIFFPPEAMQFAILMFGIAIAALFAKLAIEYI